MVSLKLLLSITCFGLALFAAKPAAMAHGVEITYKAQSGVEITALYDTGKPMAGAQVAVFSPADQANPWRTGILDKEGRFFFVPDPLAPGAWEVKVSQAGHGGVLEVEISSAGAAPAGCTCPDSSTPSRPETEADDRGDTVDRGVANDADDVGERGVAVAAPAAGFSTLQKLVMALAVLWGFTGTALYFSRRKS